MNILCFGDSNTYGYKPDGTGRFDTDTRWTCLLQKKLGADHRVIEEGLCGRTSVFQDDLREGRRGLDFGWQMQIRLQLSRFLPVPESMKEPETLISRFIRDWAKKESIM